MSVTRTPAVAELFYPADAGSLGSLVRRYLAEARQTTLSRVPKAMIVPHAGLVYSGPVAASAFAQIEPARDAIRTVVALGPSHRVPFRGIAASSADAFATPLGSVAVDHSALKPALAQSHVAVLDAAHAQEHSLEVQLPFLQEILDRFTLVPLVTGDASAAEVARILELLWGGPETLILVSSDLSHYHDYDTAAALDRATTAAIEALRPEELHGERACGYVGIRGLLSVAQRRGLQVETLDVRNSGDTAGPRDAVVGYGAYAFA